MKVLVVAAILLVFALVWWNKYSNRLYIKKNPNNIERYIAGIIKADPHPNIVTVYDVTDEYIEMEKLDIECGSYDEASLSKARDYFLKHNIAYLDWTQNNFGKDASGNTKVYDFNFSGIMNSSKDAWRVDPWPGRVYLEAKVAGAVHPLEFEEYSFQNKHLWT
jgi:hypothetical protein